MSEIVIQTRPPKGGRVLCLVHCLRLAAGVAIIVCVSLIFGCSHAMTQKGKPTRDINAVLADHDKQLLAIPGVVGVYVGSDNNQKTPCLKVMLARKDAQLERQIPRIIEGYPVVTEVTGEIRPLK
jgi:hypothetical protein